MEGLSGTILLILKAAKSSSYFFESTAVNRKNVPEPPFENRLQPPDSYKIYKHPKMFEKKYIHQNMAD
jgi:hypothetical protein